MSQTERQIRWGVLSTARIATKVCRAMHRAEGAEVVAVASRDAERARRWAAEHDVGRSYGSYEQLLEDGELDAVYIALPPSMHAEWTIRAAEAGKHVLCEKPLAANLGEAERMVGACHRHGVQLMDGVMWKHHARTAAMRGQIERGELGRLRRVTSAFTFCWDPFPEDNIRLQRKLAGGSLGDLGWYCVAASLWAFGDLPTRVWATARYYRDVEVSLSGFLWFEGDRVASFDCGFDTLLRKWFEIAGTEGSLVCDDFTGPHDVDRPRYWAHDATGASTEHVVTDAAQEVRMIERFSRLARDGAIDGSWPAESLRVQRVCDALGESARRGTPIELPAAT
jgi:predicted dehydrogenase